MLDRKRYLPHVRNEDRERRREARGAWECFLSDQAATGAADAGEGVGNRSPFWQDCQG